MSKFRITQDGVEVASGVTSAEIGGAIAAHLAKQIDFEINTAEFGEEQAVQWLDEYPDHPSTHVYPLDLIGVGEYVVTRMED